MMPKGNSLPRLRWIAAETSGKANRKGVVLPVVDEGLVVHPSDPARPLPKLFPAFEAFHRQPTPRRSSLGDPVHALGKSELVRAQVARNEIYLFLKAKLLHECRVVGRIVVHHGHGRPEFETLDEHPVSVQRPEALWTDHPIQAPPPGPGKGSLE